MTRWLRGLAVVALASFVLAAPGHTASPAPSAAPTGSAASPAASTSPEPIPQLTWTQTIPSRLPQGWLREVVAWPQGFAALGTDGRGREVVWTSPDGTTWTAGAAPSRHAPDPHLGVAGDRLVLMAVVTRGG